MDVIYLCPASPCEDCSWEGYAGDVLQHFDASHRDLLIHTNEVRLSISRPCDMNVLMLYYDDIYLIQTNLANNRLEMKLRYLGDQTKASAMRYYVEVLAGNYLFSSKDAFDNFMPVRHNNGAIEIDVDVLKCTTRIVDEVICFINFEGKPLQRTDSVSSNMYPLRQVCPNKSFFNESSDIGEVYNPKLFRSDESLDIADARKIEETIDGVLDTYEGEGSTQDYIKCATCLQTLIFPIYTCLQKHAICYTCQDKMCGICGRVVTDLRNHHMEEYTKTLFYKCKNEPKGCSKKFRGVEIYKHEMECFYSIYTCPECNWNGKYNEIDKHFRILHPSIKLVRALYNEFSANTRILINYTYGFFYCTSLPLGECIEWAVQFYGSKELCFLCKIILQGKGDTRIYSLQQTANEFRFRLALGDLKILKVKRTFLQIDDFITFKH